MVSASTQGGEPMNSGARNPDPTDTPWPAPPDIDMPAGLHQLRKTEFMDAVYHDSHSHRPRRRPEWRRWGRLPAITSPVLVAAAIIAVLVVVGVVSKPWTAPGSGPGNSQGIDSGSAAGPLLPDLADGLATGFTYCAAEGGVCSFSGTRLVAFGAGAYATKSATSSLRCAVDQFGADPAPGLVKACYVAPTGGPAGFTLCASEGATCAFNGYGRAVAYGTNGDFVERVFAKSTPCTAEAFAAPASTLRKSCYIGQPGPPPGDWRQCSVEGEVCQAHDGQPVAYGAFGAFEHRKASGTLACTSAEFGGDPVPGESKACYTRSGDPTGFASSCAAEGARCAFSGRRTVAFGASGAFVYRSFVGGVTCSPKAIGADPLPDVPKACHLTP
jgi:hypothetical protein